MIREVDLKDIDYNDSFFDSLRDDYPNFNEWFINKQLNNNKCYCTYKNNKLSSFLLLKVEDEYEDYSNFNKKFIPKRRLKICTFKVEDSNKGIGSYFIKIISNKCRELNINEVYITIYPQHKLLINFLLKNGFSYYTNKMNEKVYIKRISNLLIPIRPKYVEEIISGRKKFEYRKIKPKHNINKLIIYSTVPVKKIIGEVEVVEIIEDSVNNMWKNTNRYSGVSREGFYKYYSNTNKAIAYKLGRVNVYSKPKDLKDIGITYTPQSYVYLDD